MQFNLRLAQFEDIPALRHLIERSVRSLSVGYYTPRQIDLSLIHVFGVDTQLIDDGTYFIVEIDNRMAGCGGWSKRKTLYGGDQFKEQEDPLLDPQTEPARIRAFFVDPDYARQGIGRRLIAACEAAAIDAGFRVFEMGATLPGEPMYKIVGYESLERIDIPMPEGEVLPIVRMRKAIAG